MEILQIPVLEDNYTYLLSSGGKTAVVDSPLAEPIIAALGNRRLDFIFNTHHHRDHVGGNLALKEKYNCRILGPTIDSIPGIDEAFSGGETFSFGEEPVRVMNANGHTKGHIAFFFPESSALFCGDSLFSLGCGKLFEGTAQQLWATLESYLKLPGRTKVYCAHEFTLENSLFALAVEPENGALKEKVKAVKKLRREGKPSVPSLLADESAANPFLRPHSAILQKLTGEKEPWKVVGALREAKDRFDATGAI